MTERHKKRLGIRRDNSVGINLVLDTFIPKTIYFQIKTKHLI